MEIYKCGELVNIKLLNKKGVITCCSIRYDKTTYEISYYSGDDQKTVWLHESEFEITMPEMQKIGFK